MSRSRLSRSSKAGPFATSRRRCKSDAKIVKRVDRSPRCRADAEASAPRRPHPEGLFFPDTYFFATGSTDAALLKRAYRLMQERLDAAWASRARGLPLANPVRGADARIDRRKGDRPRRGPAAGRGRVHQSAETRHASADRSRRDLRHRRALRRQPEEDAISKAIRRSTPTFASGLPPTPIALPGQASLDAVLHPAAVPYLYFVARGDGSSEFSTNLADHNRAVAKYQRGGR